MITYELAKKLKDAGFPLIEAKGLAVNMSADIACCAMCGFPFLQIGDKYYFRPVLDVLIEACGDLYFELQGYDGEWEAYDTSDISREFGKSGKGNSPEEAVAGLFIKLQEK